MTTTGAGVTWSIVKFAICNEVFGDWEFARVCRAVKAIGYDGLELAPFTLAPVITALPADRRAELRATADEHGLQIVGLHWLLAKTTGFHLTSPEREVRRRTTAYLVALAQACHDLGGSLMVFGSPAQRSRLPGVSREQAMDAAVETFRGTLGALDDLGVSICMEPLTCDETDFVNTCDEALELVERLAHPRFVLHLDVKAMASERVPMPDLIRRHGAAAGHFHANDPNRRGPGMGDVDFAPLVAALRESGYNRWVSVEPFDYTPDPETVARESLTYMRRCLP